jgi:hypothetical protein
VAHAYNPSYSGSRDQEHHNSKPAWAITKHWAGEVAQGESPEFKPQYSKKKKKKKLKEIITEKFLNLERK